MPFNSKQFQRQPPNEEARDTLQFGVYLLTVDHRLLTVGCVQLPQRFVAGWDYSVSIYIMWVETEKDSGPMTGT